MSKVKCCCAGITIAIAACGFSTPARAQFFAAANAPTEDAHAAAVASDKSPMYEMIDRALDMLGVRYRWGGNTPETGFDCSGYVKHIFQTVFGMALPRTANEQSQVGERIAFSDLKPGDLVFFNTLKQTFSHVGIYLGDNRFVHAPNKGSNVRVDTITSDYWSRHFTGARRVVVNTPSLTQPNNQPSPY